MLNPPPLCPALDFRRPAPVCSPACPMDLVGFLCRPGPIRWLPLSSRPSSLFRLPCLGWAGLFPDPCRTDFRADFGWTAAGPHWNRRAWVARFHRLALPPGFSRVRRPSRGSRSVFARRRLPAACPRRVVRSLVAGLRMLGRPAPGPCLPVGSPATDRFRSRPCRPAFSVLERSWAVRRDAGDATPAFWRRPDCSAARSRRSWADLLVLSAGRVVVFRPFFAVAARRSACRPVRHSVGDFAPGPPCETPGRSFRRTLSGCHRLARLASRPAPWSRLSCRARFEPFSRWPDCFDPASWEPSCLPDGFCLPSSPGLFPELLAELLSLFGVVLIGCFGIGSGRPFCCPGHSRFDRRAACRWNSGPRPASAALSVGSRCQSPRCPPDSWVACSCRAFRSVFGRSFRGPAWSHPVSSWPDLASSFRGRAASIDRECRWALLRDCQPASRWIFLSLNSDRPLNSDRRRLASGLFYPSSRANSSTIRSAGRLVGSGPPAAALAAAGSIRPGSRPVCRRPASCRTPFRRRRSFLGVSIPSSRLCRRRASGTGRWGPFDRASGLRIRPVFHSPSAGFPVWNRRTDAAFHRSRPASFWASCDCEGLGDCCCLGFGCCES